MLSFRAFTLTALQPLLQRAVIHGAGELVDRGPTLQDRTGFAGDALIKTSNLQTEFADLPGELTNLLAVLPVLRIRSCHMKKVSWF